VRKELHAPTRIRLRCRSLPHLSLWARCLQTWSTSAGIQATIRLYFTFPPNCMHSCIQPTLIISSTLRKGRPALAAITAWVLIQTPWTYPTGTLIFSVPASVIDNSCHPSSRRHYLRSSGGRSSGSLRPKASVFPNPEGTTMEEPSFVEGMLPSSRVGFLWGDVVIRVSQAGNWVRTC
jgi:hypothetical protein